MEDIWGAGIRNTSSVSLELCFDGSDSELDGADDVLEGEGAITDTDKLTVVKSSISNMYPDGPPCIYYRPSKK